MDFAIEEPSVVYVRLDEANRITAVNSSAFLPDATGWTQIDSGFGDRYHHAQGNYFPFPLTDDRGICRYKLVDGAVVERSVEEMDADWAPPDERPTTEQRVDALEATTDDIILMMAELIGGA